MKFVYSSHSTAISYIEYEIPKDKNQLPIPRRQVVIAGGAGVTNKQMVTPEAVCTEVTDTDAEFLMANTEFKNHLALGFVAIERTRRDPESVFTKSKMADNDGSRPAKPGDFIKLKDAAAAA